MNAVATELLEALAAEAPLEDSVPATPRTQPSANGTYNHRLKVAEWLRDRGITFKVKDKPDNKGRTVYVLDRCLFNGEHGAPDSCVMQDAAGKMSAQCFHSSCDGYGWQEFKEQIGAPAAEHYDPPLKRGKNATPRGRSADAKQAPKSHAGGEQTEHEPAANRPSITITTEEHEVNAEAVAALARDHAIYQRGGLLVRVVRDVSPAAKGIRRPFAPRIENLPPPLLRERLAANARWLSTREKNGEIVEQPGRPPAWCVNAVHARADWPDIRHLEAVVDHPVLRPDGTILLQPGFDLVTGLLLEPAGVLPPIPTAPTRSDALEAIALLLEVVQDFPFEGDAHKAAWLAALLTPLARFAFHGPAPLFLADANVRAAGKGLLLDCIARIITGERFTVATYTDEKEELRKRITSLALAGDRLVLFDNVEGKFGNAVLDAALTGTSWKDRLLGVNRMAEAPLYMTWFATGNNVSIHADTSRRVCPIRLESPDERPEERRGFRHPDLLRYVGDNRQRLLTGGLTILRAYFVAGRPDQALTAWGSFEGWSSVVRAVLVWAGQPDPRLTCQELQNRADTTAEAMGCLIAVWEKLDPKRLGLTAAEVIQTVFKDPPKPPPDYYADFRDSIEALVGRGDSRLLGIRLRSFRRRVFRGRYFDHAGSAQRAIRWAVYPASAFRSGGQDTHHTHHTHSPDRPESECGECSEYIPAQAQSAPDEAGDGHGDSWEGG